MCIKSIKVKFVTDFIASLDNHICNMFISKAVLSISATVTAATANNVSLTSSISYFS